MKININELYERFIYNPLDELEKGITFKKGFNLILKLISAFIFIGGVVSLISGLLGEVGYINVVFSAGTFIGIRCMLSLIVCIPLTFATVCALSAIVWKRSDQLRTAEYSGLVLIFPRLLKITGEVFSILPIYLALNVLIGSLFVALPYAPLFDFLSLNKIDLPFESLLLDTSVLYEVSTVYGFGNYWYHLLNYGLLGLVSGVIFSFLIVAGAYFLAELFEIVIYFFLRKPIFEKVQKK